VPMHPTVEDFALFPVLELLFGQDREQALDRLSAAGFLDSSTRARWQTELAQEAYTQRIGHLVTAAKLMLDPLAAAEGKLSCKEPLAVLAQLKPILETVRPLGHDFSPAALHNRTVLDFGSGIFYPLSASVLLHANGFGRAIAYEPFELKIDYTVASLFELQRALFEQPERFSLFGQSATLLKQRVAALDFSDLPARLARLNRREIDHLDLGGVVLCTRPERIADASVDLLFSNSVLEHVGDLATELAWHRRVMREQAMAFHTVDFADHRYYFDPRLNIMQMYYDGVLDEINGLRPHQLESLLLDAGFICSKMPKLALPEAVIDRQRPRVPAFAALAEDDLFEWVNGYILQKPR
jgi:hypothetical protein